MVDWFVEPYSEVDGCKRGRKVVHSLIKCCVEVNGCERRGQVVHGMIESKGYGKMMERGWEMVKRHAGISN